MVTNIKRLITITFIAFLTCFANIQSIGLTGGIELTHWVNDYTGTLSDEESKVISEKLQSLEDSTKVQLVVAIISTTKPESIERFSLNLANRTGIGRKGYDDGLLMLIAKDDRKVRIELGKGINYVISDENAQVIIDDFMVPYFKKGDFYKGIDEGIDALKSHVQVGYLPIPPHARNYWMLWFFIPLIIVVEILKRFVKYRGWLLLFSIISAFLLGWLAVNTIIGLALTCFFYLVTFMMLKFPKYRLSFKRGSPGGSGFSNAIYNIGFIGTYVIKENIDTGSSRGWFSGGSSGSGFGGSSGSSGGGFSGGGGGFGGGGATGGW